MAKDYVLEKRKFVIGGVAVCIVLIYMMRLFFLQISTDDYKKNADSNAFLNKIQYPSRGAMYDRNGKLLVFNQPAYDITVVPKEVEELDTLDLCQALNITREQFLKIMADMKDRRRNPGYSRYTNQLFMSQLSAEECGVFQEKLFKFPGFYIQRRTIRQYTYNSAAHALGDIGEVSMRDIENDDYYIRGDYIGKQGVEKSYEKYLRGEKGVEILLRDAHGRIQGHYMDGQFDRPSVPGKNLTLGLFFQGTHGNDIFNGNLTNIGMSSIANITQDAYDSRWTPENAANAKWPRVTTAMTRDMKLSDRYVEDGSYFRLKTINLNYNFGSVIKGISNLSVFGTVTNVFTITGYSWFDPDVNAFGSDASRRGVDIFSYPSSRTYSIGFKLTL